MPEPADRAAPAAASKPPRPRRTRKFVLPEHHHDEQVDERTAEHIEAFLDGPDAAPHRQAETISRVRHPLELDTRPDWTAAFRREGARHARYGRPASVLLLEFRDRDGGIAVDRAARRLGDLIRAEARETDHAARVGATSFRVLLPETGGRAARRLADRLDRAFRGEPDATVVDAGAVDLCVEIASPARTGSLEDALAEAETRLRARTGTG